ncbi:unnamed protein product [Tilletia controversa]|nr:unnamed protein product [Tilletia controversa]CAD6979546.1 unnamed protein product [Tilletia controversa]
MNGTAVALKPPASDGLGPLCAKCSIRPRYLDPGTNRLHAFCGRTCASKAALKNPSCLFCSKAPKCFAPGSNKVVLDYCSKQCQQAAFNKGPCLLPIPPSDPKYESVRKQFNATSTATVHCIYQIVASLAVQRAYRTYRDAVAKRNNGKANEERRFHGTVRTCTLGIAGNTAFCNSSQCRLCLILKGGFKYPSPFTNSNGLFFAVDSKYSVTYSSRGQVLGAQKAMILARIAEGQQGRDCTLPQANHRVFQTGDAAIPAYLIMFS